MPGFWLLLLLNGVTPQVPAATCATAICWDVSPQICVTEQRDQSCRTQLQLSWHSHAPLSACLFLAEQKLHCWHDETVGHWQQLLAWQNAALTLRTADNRVLLHTDLQVLSRKPARRRLSSPWSIF
jgi:hypothetical protein